jgi:Fe2+ or Zn2+ uptake regulation protein
MTPQTKAVLECAKKLKHATNQQILHGLLKDFPRLTVTTVHRITNRLIINNILARGPEINGVGLVDSNLIPHDHFICKACDGVRDVKISAPLSKELQSQTGISLLPTSLVIYGDCNDCGHANIA